MLTSDMRAEHSGVDAAPPERTGAQPRAFSGGPSASLDYTGHTVQECHGHMATAQGRALASYVHPPGATATAQGTAPRRLPHQSSVRQKYLQRP